MSDEGYTLVEMLAALAIIGLAFGGLVESGRVVGQLQRGALASTRDLAKRNAAARALDDVVLGSGPFLSSGVGGFDGSASHFSFDCDDGSKCGARLEAARSGERLVTFEDSHEFAHLAIPEAARFRYADETGDAGFWPPSAQRIVALRAIAIDSADDPDHPLATTRLATNEPYDCIFDVVSQLCRGAP